MTDIPGISNLMPRLWSQSCLSVISRLKHGFSAFCILSASLVSAMAWQSSGKTHEELVGNLYKNGVIRSERVRDVMLSVDRRFFTETQPTIDKPIYIGFSATISAPHMHAHALEYLNNHLRPGAHALDIGSGTGYLTACMALMVGKDGVAVGVEHVPQLTELATKNIAKWMENSTAAKDNGIEMGKQLKLITGDGRNGWPENAPYDAIHVGAAAYQIPDALRLQLKVGGRLICPEGPAHGSQFLVQIDRLSESEFKTAHLMGVMYVPLTDLDKQLSWR